MTFCENFNYGNGDRSMFPTRSKEGTANKVDDFLSKICNLFHIIPRGLEINAAH